MCKYARIGYIIYVQNVQTISLQKDNKMRQEIEGAIYEIGLMLKKGGLSDEDALKVLEKVRETASQLEGDFANLEADREAELEAALEARVHESDCNAMYGDYHEEMGYLGSGRGNLYVNEDGEPLGWD